MSEERRDSTSKSSLGSKGSSTPTQDTEHASPRELEANKPAAPQIKQETEKPKDPNLVTWDGPSDEENPKNWPLGRKWWYTIAVSIFTFISPVSSSMVAPALSKLSNDLNTQGEFETELALSIFILAYAVGPLFFGPASELYGRHYVLQGSNLWYLVWNLVCGFAKNKGQFYAFRFLAGLGGSAPLAVGGGALSDIWTPDQRGKAMGIYSLAPILGPVVGPIAGGWIAEKTTWRWVFWSSSAAAGCINIFGLFALRESHAPTILKRKRNRLAKETGNENLHTGAEDKSLMSGIAGAIVRPARMFATQPIVQVIAVYMAYLFGVNYLFFATFPTVFGELYNESPGIAGLNYISIALGSFLGLCACASAVDKVYKRLKEQNNGEGRPEFRTPFMLFGSLFVTVGLFWYGWSVQSRIHWIMPNVGVVIFSIGVMVCLQAMQTYTIDCYQRYAASAMAAAAILRSLAGFAFPLFAPYLYKALDYGWGTSVLAFISIAIGTPAPIIFWMYGPKLRELSKFGAG